MPQSHSDPVPVQRLADDDCVDKTERGREEVRTRAAGVGQRARSILIMADGVRKVGDLRMAIAKLDAAADTLESLLALGLIVQTSTAAASPVGIKAALPQEDDSVAVMGVNDPERFRVAKKFMNDTVVDALGLRSFMFTLKLEKCATLADLGALVPEYSRALVKARGDEVAGALRDRLRELLS
jgi:predicted secreted protein